MISSPQPSEYAPFYANYINLAIKQGDVLSTLATCKDTTHQLLTGLPATKANYAYEPGKWTIKQVVGHLIDTERIFAYRLLRFARRDESPLPSFDQDQYAQQSDLSNRTLPNLAAEFKALREANLYLYQALTQEQLAFTGIASGVPVTVRALLYMIAGHELHHLNILNQRYLFTKKGLLV